MLATFPDSRECPRYRINSQRATMRQQVVHWLRHLRRGRPSEQPQSPCPLDVSSVTIWRQMVRGAIHFCTVRSFTHVSFTDETGIMTKRILEVTVPVDVFSTLPSELVMSIVLMTVPEKGEKDYTKSQFVPSSRLAQSARRFDGLLKAIITERRNGLIWCFGCDRRTIRVGLGCTLGPGLCRVACAVLSRLQQRPEIPDSYHLVNSTNDTDGLCLDCATEVCALCHEGNCGCTAVSIRCRRCGRNVCVRCSCNASVFHLRYGCCVSCPSTED